MFIRKTDLNNVSWEYFLCVCMQGKKFNTPLQVSNLTKESEVVFFALRPVLVAGENNFISK